MFRHIVSWNYKDEVTAERREELNAYFNKAFPELKELIPGIQKVVMAAPAHESSSKELGLYIELEDADAYAVYRDHPEHIRVAQHIRANCKDRSCLNFEA